MDRQDSCVPDQTLPALGRTVGHVMTLIRGLADYVLPMEGPGGGAEIAADTCQMPGVIADD